VATTELEADRLIAGVRGWLGTKEAGTLYAATRACTGRGVIVEIGSWKGKSTICLAYGSRAGAGVPVYAIDLHRPRSFRAFTRNVERAGVAELVRPIRGPSQQAVAEIKEPIELLFVDGAHEEHLVREDFEQWVPKVVEGGTVVFHDTVWHSGPRRVVGKELYRSRGFAGVRFVRPSTSMGRKVAENTPGDRLRARIELLKKAAFWLVTLPGFWARARIPRQARRLGRRVIGLGASR
jgi:predicted O-methyltransferase YrrM